MTDHRRPTTQGSIRAHLRAGILIVGILVIGGGGWAGGMNISGAVIAPGALVVDSNVKTVQHPTGGIVGELLVRDGDEVEKGGIVVRLDATVTQANLAIVTKGLNQLTARKARLEAERDEQQTMSFPDSLLQRAADPDVAGVIYGERRLFDVRGAARAGQKEQLRQRIAQLREEVGGNTTQEHAKSEEIRLIERELEGARDLWQRHLMPISKLTMLEREATRIAGERGQLVAAIARVRGRISETMLQIVQIDRDLSAEVGSELREIDSKIGEYQERQVAAEDQLKRMDIRAPQAGRVHQSTVHTVGGVITAGQTIMLIVPDDDKLMVEARVAPQDIDQLRIGQKAILRFSAFSQRTTPEINGQVALISPDITSDERTGYSYYTIRLTTQAEEIERLGSVKLIPGMPVEAFVQTGERVVLSYLIKPLKDQLMRAFREE